MSVGRTRRSARAAPRRARAARRPTRDSCSGRARTRSASPSSAASISGSTVVRRTSRLGDRVRAALGTARTAAPRRARGGLRARRPSARAAPATAAISLRAREAAASGSVTPNTNASSLVSWRSRTPARHGEVRARVRFGDAQLGVAQPLLGSEAREVRIAARDVRRALRSLRSAAARRDRRRRARTSRSLSPHIAASLRRDVSSSCSACSCSTAARALVTRARRSSTSGARAAATRAVAAATLSSASAVARIVSARCSWSAATWMKPPRDFGQHVELGGRALGIDDRRRRVRGVGAQLALVAELDDLRQRERRLGRVETAGSAGAEHVLRFRFQLERRAQRGGLGVCARGLEPRRDRRAAPDYERASARSPTQASALRPPP